MMTLEDFTHQVEAAPIVAVAAYAPMAGGSAILNLDKAALIAGGLERIAQEFTLEPIGDILCLVPILDVD